MSFLSSMSSISACPTCSSSTDPIRLISEARPRMIRFLMASVCIVRSVLSRRSSAHFIDFAAIRRKEPHRRRWKAAAEQPSLVGNAVDDRAFRGVRHGEVVVVLAGIGRAVMPAIADVGTCFANDCYRCNPASIVPALLTNLNVCYPEMKLRIS